MEWTLYTHTPERVFEVNLKERGMRIPALDLRLPKHESKSADADEHNDYLKKYVELLFMAAALSQKF